MLLIFIYGLDIRNKVDTNRRHRSWARRVPVQSSELWKIEENDGRGIKIYDKLSNLVLNFSLIFKSKAESLNVAPVKY